LARTFAEGDFEDIDPSMLKGMKERDRRALKRMLELGEISLEDLNSKNDSEEGAISDNNDEDEERDDDDEEEDDEEEEEDEDEEVDNEDV
jgi:tRNA A37 N6-isopentenylltransferase MiaA